MELVEITNTKAVELMEITSTDAGDTQPLYDRGARPGKTLKVSGLVPDPFLVAGGGEEGGWVELHRQGGEEGGRVELHSPQALLAKTPCPEDERIGAAAGTCSSRCWRLRANGGLQYCSPRGGWNYCVGGEGAAQKSNLRPPRGARWETLQQMLE